jgi:hypothetical protein
MLEYKINFQFFFFALPKVNKSAVEKKKTENRKKMFSDAFQ